MFNTVIRTALSCCLFLLFTNKTEAQEFAAGSKLVSLLNSDSLLYILIDSAVKNHPDVIQAENSVGVAKQNVTITKKGIFNILTAGSNYNYGNTGNLTTTQFSAFTVTRSQFYNAGIGLQVSLGTLATRKATIRSSELLVKVAEQEKASIEHIIRQDVIRLFQELRLAQRLVQAGSDSKQSAFVNYKMAEKQFLHGDITVTELARLQEISSKAYIEYGTYFNRFQTAYIQLEQYAGVSLSQLIAVL